jgi:hypothetical protein
LVAFVLGLFALAIPPLAGSYLAQQLGATGGTGTFAGALISIVSLIWFLMDRREERSARTPPHPPKPEGLEDLQRFIVEHRQERERVTAETAKLNAEQLAESERIRREVELEWPKWEGVFKEAVSRVNGVLTTADLPTFEREELAATWGAPTLDDSDDRYRCHSNEEIDQGYGILWTINLEPPLTLRTAIWDGFIRVEILQGGHEQLVKSNLDASRTADAIARLIQTQIAKHLSRVQ